MVVYLGQHTYIHTPSTKQVRAHDDIVSISSAEQRAGVPHRGRRRRRKSARDAFFLFLEQALAGVRDRATVELALACFLCRSLSPTTHTARCLHDVFPTRARRLFLTIPASSKPDLLLRPPLLAHDLDRHTPCFLRTC